MIELTDWWRIDSPAFAGQRCLDDAADNSSIEISRASVARMLVLQAADAVLHGKGAGPRDIAQVATYVGALFYVDDPEAGVLWRCLGAIRTSDTADLANALHHAARRMASVCAPHAAREFGELSYEAALACGSWEDAYFAASILTRIAELDECHIAAERWEHRARLHEARVQRRRARPGRFDTPPR